MTDAIIQDDTTWLDPVQHALRTPGANGGHVVAFPIYRPDLVRQMARALGYVLVDFRVAQMLPLGWRASEMPLDSLYEAATRHAEACTATGIVLHNAEALLATRAAESRRRWFAEALAWTADFPIVIPVAVFVDELPIAHPRVVEVDPACLPGQSLLMRLAGA